MIENGLPEPDWDLMDPVTGADLAAFDRLSARVVQTWRGLLLEGPWPELTREDRPQ